MKKAHKGFTLIEMLIVIAILGTLATTISISMGGATAKAKAVSIANNIEACKNGAALYYSDTVNKANTGDDAGKPTDFLKDESTYVPNWKEFATEGTITYTAGTEDKPDEWTVTVSFANDKESTKILSALQKIPGYKSATGTGVKVTLLTGAISAAE